MKALTICQPYALLIVTGIKRVENRTWPTRYRGPLLIHAGKSKAWLDEVDDLTTGKCERIDYDETTGRIFDFGALVGVADLVDCIQVGDAPVPCKGAQGLWECDDFLVPYNARLSEPCKVAKDETQ